MQRSKPTERLSEESSLSRLLGSAKEASPPYVRNGLGLIDETTAPRQGSPFTEATMMRSKWVSSSVLRKHRIDQAAGRRFLSTSKNNNLDYDHTDESSPSRFWKKHPTSGRYQRPIYVAATKQHVGETFLTIAVASWAFSVTAT